MSVYIIESLKMIIIIIRPRLNDVFVHPLEKGNYFDYFV